MQFSIRYHLAASMILLGAVSAIDWGRICTDVNLRGNCVTYQSDDNQCVSLPQAAPNFNDAISSFSVNPDSECTFFIGHGCTDGSNTFQPGTHNTVPNNDNYSAFLCNQF